ncbi:MAG TPA: helix-turn-helix domain-containing protein [Burkholderiales bacterium]|nr:helix-turn-helix domain-containing protein [Burkholderiales bacterium]
MEPNSQAVADLPHLMSREQAAQYLGVSPETLAVWASTKRYNLPFVKMGRLAKYRKTDLDAFITSRTTGALPVAA